MLDFAAASAQSNGSDHSGDNDSVLHVLSPVVFRRAEFLASNFGSGRNVRPKLQRLMLDFATACAERNSRDYSRHYEYTLKTLHRLLSLSFGSRQYLGTGVALADQGKRGPGGRFPTRMMRFCH